MLFSQLCWVLSVTCLYLFLGKEEASAVEMTIPGLDWGMDELMQKDQKKVPQKKVPYAKPIPAQFQQVSAKQFL